MSTRASITILLVFVLISVLAIPLTPNAHDGGTVSLADAKETLRLAMDRLGRMQEKLDTALQLKAEYDLIYIKQELGKSIAGQVGQHKEL